MAPPRRLLLVSSPRTASNLLLKILALPDQPDVLTNEKGGYFFFSTFVSTTKDGRVNKPLDQWAVEDHTDIQSSFKEGLDQMEEYSARAEQEGKVFFAKEHASFFANPATLRKILLSPDADNEEHTSEVEEKNAALFRQQVPSTYGSSQTFSAGNNTVLPDEYLRTFRMAFIIRHPALMFPSMYRAMSKMLTVGVLKETEIGAALAANLTLKFSRDMYDWCLAQNNPEATPVIIDAHDVIHNPQSIIRFCQLTGLDSNKLKFEWDNSPGSSSGSAASAQALQTEQRTLWREGAGIMVSTLTGSSGVMKSKAPEMVDIAVEAAKWKKEFGEEVAQTLERATVEAMPDYEYMKARRVTM